MPKLWNDSIEAHRQAVRDATLDTTAALAATGGITAVTMSRVAKETGIGRATLYKYFPDVEAILVAWHERQIARHLHELETVSQAASGATERLEAVLGAYAVIAHEHHGTALSGFLHGREHARHAEQHLRLFITALVAGAVDEGRIRGDVVPDELATFALSALSAASHMTSNEAVHRLVDYTINGMLKPSN